MPGEGFDSPCYGSSDGGPMGNSVLTVLALLAASLGAGCTSAPDRCFEVKPGTRIDSLPVLRGPTGCTSCSAPSSNAEGQALFCCASRVDAGCGLDCSTLPPADIYEMGSEYAGGRCDDNVGTWLCGAWVRDGAVVATFVSCSD